MTREELETWEKFAVSFATTVDIHSNYVADNCRKVAKYADQMLIEWRKRKEPDNSYRECDRVERLLGLWLRRLIIYICNTTNH